MLNKHVGSYLYEVLFCKTDCRYQKVPFCQHTCVSVMPDLRKLLAAAAVGDSAVSSSSDIGAIPENK